MSERPLYAFFGHHKCATGWIDSVLRETCFHLGWRFLIVHTPERFAPYGSLGGFVEQEKPDLLSYTNANMAYLDTLPPFRGFHVVRDPRDVVVSGYFSHLHSHPTDNWPELEAHRAKLKALSKEEGLMLELDFSRQFLQDMRTWDYQQPHILEMKLEDISPDPWGAYHQIFSHLGFLQGVREEGLDLPLRSFVMTLNVLNQRGRRFTPFHMPIFPMRFPLDSITERTLDKVLARKNFKKLSGGRKAGQENVKSHYRKGKAGDWRNHFGPDHIAYFHQEYQDILEKLGYESDASWVDAVPAQS